MIHYQLRCQREHAFDGWFRDSEGFEHQSKAGLVTCPECGSNQVVRSLMSPAIPRKSSSKRRPAPVIDQAGIDQAGINQAAADQAGAQSPVAAPTRNMAGTDLPDQIRAMLQKLRSEVEKRCENVGDRFAEEARAIHQGKSQTRGIYGQTTPEQAEALAEEGIEVAQIPWVPRADG